MTYEPYLGPYSGDSGGGAGGGFEQYPTDIQVPSWQPPPPSVINAVRVMYAGAAVSVISVIAGLVASGSAKSGIRAAHPDLTASQVSAYAEFDLVSVLIVGLVGVGMWIWLARMCRDGRRVVRVVGTVLFGVDTLLQGLGFTQPVTLAARIPGLLVWLVGLVAVVLLWRRDAADYFNAEFNGEPSEGQPW
jgi:hypothetical protein